MGTQKNRHNETGSFEHQKQMLMNKKGFTIVQVSSVYIFCADMVHVLVICMSRINEAQGKSHQRPMLISELFYRASTFLTDFPTYGIVPSFQLDNAEGVHF